MSQDASIEQALATPRSAHVVLYVNDQSRSTRFWRSTPGIEPRAELYLMCDQPEAAHRRALLAGGAKLSPLQPRDPRREAAYSLDADGHVLAFARESS